MKKHLRIFLTTIILTFSFCFISSVKANQMDISEFTLPSGVSPTTHNILIEYSTWRYGTGYFAWIIPKSENKYFTYYGSYTYPTINSSTSNNSGGIRVTSYPGSTSALTGQCRWSWGTNPQSTPTCDSNSSQILPNPSTLQYTNTIIYNTSGGVWYEPILDQTYTVNFHLNGGTVSDFSDPEHDNFIELDYQIETTSEELAEYILLSIIPYREDYHFMGWYYDSNFTNMYDGNDNLTSDIDLYAKWEYAMPDYLHGYKRVNLTPENKYVMISYVDSGSVFIPTEEFYKYGGRVSYYDNDLEIQPYVSYIQDYTEMSDGLFIRQDFDLSTYNGADWVMFSKYIYLEGEDNISYYVYVPEDSYNSKIVITPNEQGGNNFDFTYKDENGDIQTGQVVSEDISNSNLSTSDIFGEISIFLNKMKRATTSIKEIFTYLFNSLNSTIKSFIIFVIVLILISTVIRFARRG